MQQRRMNVVPSMAKIPIVSLNLAKQCTIIIFIRSGMSLAIKLYMKILFTDYETAV